MSSHVAAVQHVYTLYVHSWVFLPIFQVLTANTTRAASSSRFNVATNKQTTFGRLHTQVATMMLWISERLQKHTLIVPYFHHLFHPYVQIGRKSECSITGVHYLISIIYRNVQIYTKCMTAWGESAPINNLININLSDLQEQRPATQHTFPRQPLPLYIWRTLFIFRFRFICIYTLCSQLPGRWVMFSSYNLFYPKCPTLRPDDYLYSSCLR